ncbi:hypothetical protein L8N14_018860, partial [Serratia marcescens]|nr:hypothetical protein [Serratia marcescens]
MVALYRLDVFFETPAYNSRRGYISAIIETFDASRNIFRLPGLEAMMTPLDFAAITGLPSSQYVLQTGAAPAGFTLTQFFGGRLPPSVSDGTTSIPMARLLDGFRREWTAYEQMTEEELGGVFRAFLLYFVGMTLFPTGKKSTVNRRWAHLLMATPEELGQLDWSGAAYAYLMHYVRR